MEVFPIFVEYSPQWHHFRSEEIPKQRQVHTICKRLFKLGCWWQFFLYTCFYPALGSKKTVSAPLPTQQSNREPAFRTGCAVTHTFVSSKWQRYSYAICCLRCSSISEPETLFGWSNILQRKDKAILPTLFACNYVEFHHSPEADPAEPIEDELKDLSPVWISLNRPSSSSRATSGVAITSSTLEYSRN